MNYWYRISGVSIVLAILILACSTDTGWIPIGMVERNGGVNIESLIFFNPSEGIAVSRTSIFLTNDGGKSWKKTEETPTSNYLKIIKGEGENAAIIGSESRDWEGLPNSENLSGSHKVQPLILTTSNKGIDWHKLGFSTNDKASEQDRFPSANDLCIDRSGAVWIATDKGVVQNRLVDQALEMVDLLPTESRFIALDCTDPNEVLALTVSGELWKHNGQWKRELIPRQIDGSIAGPVYWAKLSRSNGVLWALGNRDVNESGNRNENLNGILMKRDNENEPWTNVTPVSNTSFVDISILGNNVRIIGSNGAIYHSTDMGKTWTTENNTSKANLTSIYFLPTGEGWISTASGQILAFRG